MLCNIHTLPHSTESQILKDFEYRLNFLAKMISFILVLYEIYGITHFTCNFTGVKKVSLYGW